MSFEISKSKQSDSCWGHFVVLLVTVLCFVHSDHLQLVYYVETLLKIHNLDFVNKLYSSVNNIYFKYNQIDEGAVDWLQYVSLKNNLWLNQKIRKDQSVNCLLGHNK